MYRDHKMGLCLIVRNLIACCALFMILPWTIKAKSIVVSNFSSWDFWYMQYFRNSANDKSFLSGSSLVGLSTQAGSPIILYFGVNSGKDNNFHSNEQSVYADLFLQVNDKSGNYRVGFNPGYFSLSQEKKERDSLSDFRFNFNERSQPFILDGAYLQYNHSFAIGYSKILMDDSTTITLNYIPNLNFNLSASSNSYAHLYSGTGALDLGVDYYGEYRDVGYGVTGVARMYLGSRDVYKGEDLYFTTLVEYLGVSASWHFLYGLLNLDPRTTPYVRESTETSYQLNEIECEYKVSSFDSSFVFGYNNVTYVDLTGAERSFYNNHFVVNAAYVIDKNFSIKASIFYEKESLNTNTGIALGFNVGV